MKTIILFTLLGLALASQKLYKGYKVIQTIPKTSSDVKLLQELEVRGDYDFWKAPNRQNLPVDIMVAPDQVAGLEYLLKEREMEYKIMIEDVEKLIPRNRLEVAPNPKVKSQKYFDFENYYRLDNIYDYLDRLAQKHSDIIKQEVIGTSIEGRQQRLLTVSSGASATKGVWIDSGIHAREWISPAVGLFLLTELVENKNNWHFLEKFHFYFLPMVNPDGYEFSHTNDRLWRKNRVYHPEFDCYGTDMNRNFPHRMWGEAGTSAHPCAINFHGDHKASETETRNFVAAVRRELPNDITLFLTLHSYSQLVMIPYGYQVNPIIYAEDHEELERLGLICSEALYNVHGTYFQVGNSAALLGAAAGATDDWAKDEQNMGIKYVYTIELRDRGQYGFVLPPDQIIPSGEEMWACVDAMLKDLKYK